MVNYVEKLLIDLGYLRNKFKFFNKEGDDFFRVDEYTELELLNYFKDEITRSATADYENLIKLDDAAKVNSAQIILVKVDDLRVFFSKHKNQLMKIEEDPYYFRKYIIVYTEESVAGISNYSLSELEQFVLSDENYKYFEGDIFSMSTYFLGMECYIKLPFLTLPIRNEKYSSLDQLISEEIDKEDQKLAEANVIKVADFMNSKGNDNVLTLESLTTLESESEIIILLKELY